VISAKEVQAHSNLWLWASGFLCLWSLLFIGNPFFFDTVLYSRQADWYLQSGFTSLILPSDIDAGHPPFFALYLASGWWLGGQSVWVSHLIMLPACILLGWGLAKLIEAFVAKEYQYSVLILTLCEPTLLAQSSLVANDIVLVSGAFLAFAGIHSNRPHWLGMGMLLSAAVSLRGIMLWPVLGIYILLFHRPLLKRFQIILIPVLWIVPLVFWLLFHYWQTGWLTRPVSTNWSSQHNFTDLDGIVHNILSIGFRFVDHGRIYIGLILFWFVWQYRSLVVYKLHPLLGLILIGVGVHILWFLPFQNPPGHRYFLTWYLLILIFLGVMMFQYLPNVKRLWLSCIVVLISGHAWVYPDSISKGWDSSIAYLPWSSLRSEALVYMKQQAIRPSQVGSSFPLLHAGRYTHLNGESWQFGEKDLNKQVYILYSNVCSGFSDEDIATLEKYWDVEAQWGSWPVRFILYRNPEQIPSMPSGEEMASLVNCQLSIRNC
jgi:hypothetical protein